MTTATVEKGTYKELARGTCELAKIAVVSNFRKHYDQARLKELAENIRKVGVLEPVLTREGKGGKMILVAGERRLKASELAGIPNIPFRMLELTEDEANEVQAMENLHRRDLTPLEEARAFKILLDAKGHTLERVQDLADRVGKSSTYIYRAVRLLELPDYALKKIEDGTITAAHGHQLLRLLADHRKKAWNETNWHEPVKEIERHINNRLGCALSKGGFPLDKPYAGAEACTKCVYNSSNQGMLFDGADKGNCLNMVCFKKKHDGAVEAVRQRVIADFKGLKFLGVMTHTYDIKGKLLDFKTAFSKIIDAERKTNPGNFAWCILDSSMDYGEERGIHAKLICLEPRKLSKEAKKLVDPYSGSYGGGGSRQLSTTPKQKFIRMAKYRALFEAARKTCAKGLTAAHYRVIAEQLEPGHYHTRIPQVVIGVKEKKNPYYGTDLVYSDLTLDQLRDLVLLFSLDRINMGSRDPDVKEFQVIGVDTKKVTAAAAKQAEANWEAKKAEKKTPAKTVKE